MHKNTPNSTSIDTIAALSLKQVCIGSGWHSVFEHAHPSVLMHDVRIQAMDTLAFRSIIFYSSLSLSALLADLIAHVCLNSCVFEI